MVAKPKLFIFSHQVVGEGGRSETFCFYQTSRHLVFVWFKTGKTVLLPLILMEIPDISISQNVLILAHKSGVKSSSWIVHE
jgi:hypothetical protein